MITRISTFYVSTEEIFPLPAATMYYSLGTLRSVSIQCYLHAHILHRCVSTLVYIWTVSMPNLECIILINKLNIVFLSHPFVLIVISLIMLLYYFQLSVLYSWTWKAFSTNLFFLGSNKLQDKHTLTVKIIKQNFYFELNWVIFGILISTHCEVEEGSFSKIWKAI